MVKKLDFAENTRSCQAGCEDQLRRKHFAWFRRVLLQRWVRPGRVVVRKIRRQDSAQTGLMANDYVIQAFPPNRADQPLNISPLPGRPWSRQHLLNVQVPDLAAELVTEDFVLVSQQMPRDLLKGKRLPQLLRGLLRGRVSRYAKVHHPPPLVRQHQKHVQHLEADRGHGEEIDRD
jgi:hypothetical protein